MMCSNSQHFRDYIGSLPEFLSGNKVRKHEVIISETLYDTGCWILLTLTSSSPQQHAVNSLKSLRYLGIVII